MINTQNLKENRIYKVILENWNSRLAKFINWQFQDISNYDVYGSFVTSVKELSIDISQLIKDLDEFISFMQEQKWTWTLLTSKDKDISILKKEFIENLNDVFDKRKMRVWVSLSYYKWTSDRLEKLVSIEFFIDKKTMDWKQVYKYEILNFIREDDIYEMEKLAEFKKFFLKKESFI